MPVSNSLVAVQPTPSSPESMKSIADESADSHGSNSTSDLSQKLQATIEYGQDVQSVGEGLLADIALHNEGAIVPATNDTVMGGENAHKKRTFTDATVPSEKSGLLAYASQSDPVHVISQLPADVQSFLQETEEGPDRNIALTNYLNSILKGMPPLQQAIMQQQQMPLQQFEAMKHFLDQQQQQNHSS